MLSGKAPLGLSKVVARFLLSAHPDCVHTDTTATNTKATMTEMPAQRRLTETERNLGVPVYTGRDEQLVSVTSNEVSAILEVIKFVSHFSRVWQVFGTYFKRTPVRRASATSPNCPHKRAIPSF